MIYGENHSTTAFVPTPQGMDLCSLSHPVFLRSGNGAFSLYAQDPLATEGDWAAYVDKDTTGMIYYFNEETGESRWEPPTDTFPPINLSRKETREMEKKQNTYYESPTTAASKDKSGNKGGFFSSVFGSPDVGTPVTTEIDVIEDDSGATNNDPLTTEIKQPSGFLSGIFGNEKRENIPEPTTRDAEIDEMEKNLTEQQDAKRKQRAGFFSSFGAKKFDKTVQEEAAYEVVVGDMGDIAIVDEETEAAEMEAKPAVTKFEFPDVLSVFKAKQKEADIIIPTDTPIKVEMSAFVLPHPEKVSWGGEDAVFTEGRTFGVFDGVSGAEKSDGVALYSMTLAQQMKKIVGKDGITVDEITDLLTEAAEFADIEATGASTAVVASIGEDGFLRSLNLGDSILLVIRDGVVVARSREIVHYFDCPYQLAEDSPDRPKDGTQLKTEVLPGDIVLVGSDGIFDNLSDEFICKTVATVPERASFIAKRVVEESRRVSLDPEAETPYAKLAKKNKYEEYTRGLGGKLDDISCIAVRCL